MKINQNTKLQRKQMIINENTKLKQYDPYKQRTTIILYIKIVKVEHEKINS